MFSQFVAEIFGSLVSKPINSLFFSTTSVQKDKTNRSSFFRPKAGSLWMRFSEKTRFWHEKLYKAAFWDRSKTFLVMLIFLWYGFESSGFGTTGQILITPSQNSYSDELHFDVKILSHMRTSRHSPDSNQ